VQPRAAARGGRVAAASGAGPTPEYAARPSGWACVRLILPALLVLVAACAAALLLVLRRRGRRQRANRAISGGRKALVLNLTERR
jgi:hypothetical protein